MRMTRLDYGLTALPLVNYIFMVYLFCQVVDLPILLLQLSGQGALGAYGWILPRSWQPHNISSSKTLLNILQLSLVGFLVSSLLLPWHTNAYAATASSIISSFSFYYCLFTITAIDERVEPNGTDLDTEPASHTSFREKMKSYFFYAALFTLTITLFGNKLIWGHKYDTFILRATMVHAVLNSTLVLCDINPFTADAIASEIDERIELQYEHSEKRGLLTNEVVKPQSRKVYHILTIITSCAFLIFCSIFICLRLMPAEKTLDEPILLVYTS